MRRHAGPRGLAALALKEVPRSVPVFSRGGGDLSDSLIVSRYPDWFSIKSCRTILVCLIVGHSI